MKERIKKMNLSSSKRKEILVIYKKSSVPDDIKKGTDKTLSTLPEESNKISEQIKGRDITKIKRINIKSFRGLKDIDLSIGDNITLISGRNGTCKSTILGIIAQCFSFYIDYTQKDESGKFLLLPYKTLSGKRFISYATEHFRLSEKHDLTGTMDINIEVYDAVNQIYLDKLQLRLTQEKNKNGILTPRSRIRNNQNTDRAITHPVIYLGLKRMFPISERKYEEKENAEFIKNNINDFLKDNNNILIKSSRQVTTTLGIVNSIVAYSDDYDHQSVSVGEDNIGQILQAIYSFKKLKKDMGDKYKGGVLLIDEIDASLFCAAQIRLMGLLERYSKELQLQIILTSHSVDIMERIYKSSRRKGQENNFKVYYLTNAYGKIQLLEDIEKMKADIKDCIPEELMINSPTVKVNVYTEDQEARDFLIRLCKNSDIKQDLNILDELYIGCKNYKQFIKYNIPEFTKKSLIILDGDNRADQEFNSYQNVICLPKNIPPDQLLFEYLLNKDENDLFWVNNQIPRSTIISLSFSQDIITTLDINTGEKLNLVKAIEQYRESDRINKKQEPLRTLFKKWYKSSQIQLLINSKSLYEHWIEEHSKDTEEFLNILRASINIVQNHL